jgi:ectoine hydroxylase-related dioxygenase (phytanoyl-CoA dioxygenase family)
MVQADYGRFPVNAMTSIDASVRQGWDRDGWTLVPGLIGAGELVEFRREADRLWGHASHFAERGVVPNSPARSDRLDPFIDLSPQFADLARDPRLLEVAGRLLGGEAQLMKDKFIFKPAGTGGYAAHQDGAYWQGIGLDLDRFLTAFLFLDGATKENGAVECTSGQHRSLLTEPGVIADPRKDQLGSFTTIGAAAGDLLLVHALTPHRSGPNRSRAMRRALAFTYGVDARPDLYSLYQQSRRGSPS